jgi:hypothetical protein
MKRKADALERLHQHRRRKRAGIILAQIEIDPALVELLIDADFLPPWHADNPQHVRDALTTALACWSRG